MTPQLFQGREQAMNPSFGTIFKSSLQALQRFYLDQEHTI